MSSRRDLLRPAAGLGTVGVAGCSGALGSGRTRHFLDVLNGTEEAHTFAVTGLDADDAVLFEHEYALDAKSGEENRVVEWRPARVEVGVDGGEPDSIAWEPRSDSSFVTSNPDGCADGTTTSLTIRDGNATDAALEPVFGCETVG